MLSESQLSFDLFLTGRYQKITERRRHGFVPPLEGRVRRLGLEGPVSVLIFYIKQGSSSILFQYYHHQLHAL